MIGFLKKRHLLGAKNWNGFYFSAESIFQESVSKQNFYACSKEKENYVAPTFRLQSIKRKITWKNAK